MKSISVKYGLGIGVLLIIVFLILSIFNLHLKPFYSAINIAVMGIGLYLAIRVCKNEFQKDQLKSFTYQKGFSVGVVTGFISTIIFSVFFAIYASNIEPGFIDKMLVNWNAGYEVGVGTTSFIVFLMGLATTVVLSLSLMQIMKDTWNTSQGRKYTVSDHGRDTKY
ncbi:DUF4199 domain-containing protein [Mesonia aestuariivivens]|uniref:DUF4199 domain-containing protein n=1 Tax=Mesonia aestuariivivens TaxID=2796128 RepID=A0ABS6VXQ5_9FLAO|nr:DUF4199 domain-containing protein [Mesonia aestuariivivens]MBW2960369.1 DUF4199 domain-containing protein [Mesonia aestuariivivens]